LLSQAPASEKFVVMNKISCFSVALRHESDGEQVRGADMESTDDKWLFENKTPEHGESDKFESAGDERVDALCLCKVRKMCFCGSA
jgi:hypothetical protein